MSNWLTSYRSTRRRSAKNFTHSTANKRMREAIDQQKSSVTNAVQVDGCSAIVLKHLEHGRPCSCRKTVGYEADSHHQENDPDSFGIDVSDSDWFGEDAHGSDDFSVLEAGDLLAGNDPSTFEEDDENTLIDRTFDSDVNCGICYRTGFNPAFSTVGYEYLVMTNYDVVDSVSYSVDQANVPSSMVKCHDDGRVYFEFVVPKYFKSCRVSIRNNTTVLNDLPKYDLGQGKEKELDLAYLNSLRGGLATIYVDVEEFTHVAILFNMGGDEIMVNLSEEAGTLDFGTLNTVGSMSVILPPNVGWVKPSDYIWIEKRNLMLKVTDSPKKSLSDKTQFEWIAQTRVCQPQEHIKHIFKSRQIF